MVDGVLVQCYPLVAGLGSEPSTVSVSLAGLEGTNDINMTEFKLTTTVGGWCSVMFEWPYRLINLLRHLATLFLLISYFCESWLKSNPEFKFPLKGYCHCIVPCRQHLSQS